MNYYSEVIDVLSVEQDWKRMVINIAKKHPKLVCHAATDESWMVEARALMTAGEKIAAIKYCRSMTGMGLKEAKEAVEAIKL